VARTIALTGGSGHTGRMAAHPDPVSSAPGVSVEDCRIIPLRTIDDPRGSLTFVEGERDLPFAIKRVYHLYGVPPAGERGAHAHRQLQQVIIAVAGSFAVHVDDAVSRRVIHLDSPVQGLLIPPGIWRDMRGFSGSAICLVLASELYDAADYVRDYDEFVTWRRS
jgi:hypothetical protein